MFKCKKMVLAVSEDVSMSMIGFRKAGRSRRVEDDGGAFSGVREWMGR